MSKTSRRPRRAARHLDYGIQLGWCESAADLDTVRRETHDTLIANMGHARTGGVSWSIVTGDDAFKRLSTLFEHSPSPEHSESYRRIRGMLREYGGFLVIASAAGIKP